MELLIKVEHQKLRLETKLRSLAEGSQNFVKLKFDLDEDWNGLTVFAQFQQDGKGYNQYLSPESIVSLPPEIKNGRCYVMLYGTGGDVIGTTSCLDLYIDTNNFVSDAQSVEISESLYNQLVDKVNNFMTYDKESIPSVVEAIKALDDAMARSESQYNKLNELITANENAKVNADNAKLSEEKAANSEKSSQESANSAAQSASTATDALNSIGLLEKSVKDNAAKVSSSQESVATSEQNVANAETRINQQAENVDANKAAAEAAALSATGAEKNVLNALKDNLDGLVFQVDDVDGGINIIIGG